MASGSVRDKERAKGREASSKDRHVGLEELKEKCPCQVKGLSSFEECYADQRDDDKPDIDSEKCS